MTLGYDQPLYLLAFDHRGSFEKGLFGTKEPVSAEVKAGIVDAKESNPEGDAELNKRQLERLARLSRWLREHDRKILYELLVPPTTEQLDRYEDSGSYDRELRPPLVVDVIHRLQAGVVYWTWGGTQLGQHDAILASRHCLPG
jgi:hypothetical protein